MKNIQSLLWSIPFIFQLQAQLKSPDDFLGYPLGSQFTRHHQVVDYVQHLAENSDYAQYLPYGKTYENRTLQLVVLARPDRLETIETVRKNHLRKIGFEQGSSTQTDEVGVVWLSYNVHGNESTSTEAAMKTLYTLVTEKKEWLSNLVVLVDPCINPDGRDRYVNWYNQIKSTPYDSNPIANEHHEEWPGGRYNHYYHDLNRDWTWLSQVESQQRLPHYLSWMPHVHVDFHEQGVNSPYYFAPAVEPYHEVVTDFQREFQETIGKNNAKYFDAAGWRYFTKEVFDLLYPGYGDTYPMFNGAIGMTYEQGGSGRAGLSIRNELGNELTLKDRLEHHHISGLSTVEVTHKNVARLNAEFKKYHTQRAGKYSAYLLDGNPNKQRSLKRLLDAHQIPTKALAKKTSVKGIDYDMQKSKTVQMNENALVVIGNGKKAALVQALFEPKTHYSDSLTYDITAWSIPYAHGLKAVATNQKLDVKPFAENTNYSPLPPNAYAYATERKSLTDGIFLSALIKAGIRVFYNQVPLVNGGKRWNEGSLFILSGANRMTPNLSKKIDEIAKKTNQKIIPLTTGYSEEGPDLGSNRMQFIKNRRVGILKSDKASPINYGEIWHFFEQQLHYPLVQLSDARLYEAALNEIDVLIIPHGYYTRLFDEQGTNALSQWLKKGGRIVAIGSALNAFDNHPMFSLVQKTTDEDEPEKPTPYAAQERENIRSVIYGSIYKATVDPTHPLASGFDKHYYTLKTRATGYDLLPYNGTAAYLEKNSQPIAGFSGDKAIKKQSQSLLFGMEAVGNGTVVYCVDNPLYRNFWENGKLWLINAVFN